MSIAIRILAILMMMMALASGNITISQRPGHGNFTELQYCVILGNKVLIKMADHYTFDEELNDPWFDRLVTVYMSGKYDHYLLKPIHELEEPPVAIAAVVIAKDRVLTALNPVRNAMAYKFKRHYTLVCYNFRRYWNPVSGLTTYNIRNEQIACARPVVPIGEEQRPDMWQQLDYEPRAHLPLHDLVVMRTNEPFRTDIDGVPFYNTTFFTSPKDFMDKIKTITPANPVRLGPVKTLLAKIGDDFGKDLKFGMFGHIISGLHMERRNVVVHKYESQEAIADCDAWIPRAWGIFICLNNIRGLDRLPAGSMLYSKGLLFGVGCFLLSRESKSVLVFTDVRPYYDLILNTCTVEDQSLKPPNSSTLNITLG